MNESFLLFWHRWRWAIWAARRDAAMLGRDVLQDTGLRYTAKGEAWRVRLYMQEQLATGMAEYHEHRVMTLRPKPPKKSMSEVLQDLRRGE